MNYEQGLIAYVKLVKNTRPNITFEELKEMVDSFELEMKYQANDLRYYNIKYDRQN
jgi:methionine aminopeptidase